MSFLEIIKEYSIPAGTVMLLSSASHMVAVGTAEYTADFVRSNIKLREALAGGVRVMHGVPLLIGGTNSIPAIRTMAEISQWVKCTSELNSDIFATRSLWEKLIRTSDHGTDCTHIMSLPLSQHKLEMATFTSGGFSNLMAAAPLDEESERSIVLALLHELYEMYSTELSEDPIIDRYMKDDVFKDEDGSKEDIILIGASHLNQVADRLDSDKWNVINLCKPGFRISDESVAMLTREIGELGKTVQLKNTTVILQLFDNSDYQVEGSGGVRHLPVLDSHRRYHINGTLQVADKVAIKEMTAILLPLIKALGQARKAFLSLLTHQWLKPCCNGMNYHLKYSAPTYLPALGASVFRLRDNIRDALFTRRTSNCRVVCSNKLMGIGPQLSNEMAHDVSRMWGGPRSPPPGSL